MAEWGESVVYANNTFYFAIKHGILSFVGEQMGLEVIMLNEINKAWKDKSHMFSHFWNSDLKLKIKLGGRR